MLCGVTVLCIIKWGCPYFSDALYLEDFPVFAQHKANVIIIFIPQPGWIILRNCHNHFQDFSTIFSYNVDPIIEYQVSVTPFHLYWVGLSGKLKKVSRKMEYLHGSSLHISIS